ncbi:MAG: hypothetical protein ACK5L6_10385 [Anaerorhabdus sp.]
MNQQLLDKFFVQQEMKEVFMLNEDILTRLANTLKYDINKMCIIKIENSNLLVSRFR